MKRIINEYIEYTKKSIRQYMKLIFENYLDNEVLEEFMITYINSRYYNIYNGKSIKKAFSVKIMEELDRKYSIISTKFKEMAKKQKITIDIREEKEKIMVATREAFDLLIIWDSVKEEENNKNLLLNNSMDIVEKIRKKYYNLESSDELKKDLLSKIKDDILKKDVYLDNLGSDVFRLKFSRNKKKHHIYYTKLEQNIRFPVVYSDRIIDRVFREDIIAEDCLKVQFTLLSAVIIRDIIKGNFKDVYIVTMPEELPRKKVKIESVLGNIDTQVLQDKIYLKIYYNDFQKNKQIIYKLINKGYKFVIEIDKYFTDIEELENLKVFKYVLLSDKLRISREIQKYMNKYDNILEK